MIYLYIGVMGCLLTLMVLSGGEEIPDADHCSAFLRPVRRTAVWLYRICTGLRSKPGKGGYSAFPGAGKVEKDLSLLDPSKGRRQREARYYIGKIQDLLLFILAADLLAAAVWYSGRSEGIISSDGTIERPDYGEDSLTISVEAYTGETADSAGTYTVSVGARKYTEEETQEMALELFDLLPERILGENEDLLSVTEDLNLISEEEGYPFRIRWYSSLYEVIDSDGTVQTDALEEGGAEVTLTAKLTYEEWTFEQTYDIHVYPISLSGEEQLTQDIQTALEISEEESSQEGTYRLPEEVDGIAIFWQEESEDSSFLLFGLILAAGAAIFILRDRDLHDKVQKRERQLAVDYPQVISKLVLFLGAGMSVRNAFLQLGETYLEKIQKGGEKRYVYEEILLVCREMDSGISENAALSHFGTRCGTRQYTKLCSLLVQNLRKGNSALLTALQEEADLAFEERKNLARKMGEEAGTRLLLPMVLMLGVTLVMIMIPAFMSFT